MVFVNAQKFACASCIKGHRSSSCFHVDRPLFQVRRKGRPVSQCTECRDARKSNRYHGRCSCETQPSQSTHHFTRGASNQPTPAYPNGIRDILDSIDVIPAQGANPKQRVNSLLNPCSCKDVYSCSCKPASEPRAKASCCSGRKQVKAPLAPTPAPQPSQQSRGPELPPILASEDDDSTPFIVSDIGLSPLPRLETISSIAGSGCSCGVTCECPGCEEHHVERTRSHPSSHEAHNCAGCVDNLHGVELPKSDAFWIDSPSSAFLTMAARLPPPPTLKQSPSQLNPHDVRVFPMSPGRSHIQQKAFGLVQVPKLQCCAGNCGCTDQCGCGESCGGCCA